MISSIFSKKNCDPLHKSKKNPNFAPQKHQAVPERTYFGEMAEWSIAAVLKTVEGHTSGGSNPSLSASEKDLS